MTDRMISVARLARIFDVPLWVVAERDHQRPRIALTASRARLSIRRRGVLR